MIYIAVAEHIDIQDDAGVLLLGLRCGLKEL